MSDTLTLKTFLLGLSPLMDEKAVQYVCSRMRINADKYYFELDERESDLSEGYAYYWLSNLPVGGATEKVGDGGWSHSRGGWTVSKANIEEWLRKYRMLFSKWNETPLEGSKIRLINLC